ncbi:MAG: enoyl-CoA hydratase-related protein [Actinomycetota bacterium]|nr:enoyl-CoA hydratase-related protein [Actinomycetota bacterium]
MDAYTQILTEARDGVQLITYNRPDRLNAWTRQMGRELTSAIEAANNDRSIGAIVVTGAGRGFCAGADMAAEFQAGLDSREAGAQPAERTRTDADENRGGSDWVALVRRSKPMVAAVNGVAIGMGLSMILPFDRIVSGRSARFSARFIKVGVVPELASTMFLPQRVGFGAASDLMLSARIIDAEEASRLGLVDELVDDEALVDTALARARSYAENAPPHLLWVKELLTVNMGETDIAATQQREIAALEAAYRTPEHREAVAAFLEKRPANFQGLGPS